MREREGEEENGTKSNLTFCFVKCVEGARRK